MKKHLIASVFLGVLTYVFLPVFAGEKTTSIPTEKFSKKRWEHLNKNRLPSPLSTNFYPVFLFRTTLDEDGRKTENWIGSGTALAKDEKLVKVYTTSTHFNEDGMYYVRVVFPKLDEKTWSIASVSCLNDMEDIAVARIGEKTLINKISRNARAFKTESAQILPINLHKHTPVSLITGEEMTVIGLYRVKNEKNDHHILEYTLISGEYGTGFFEPPNKLFILVKNIVLDLPQSRDLGVDLAGDQIAVARGIKVE